MVANRKRTFIIDFGCCLTFGHNLQVVNLYRRAEEKRGQQAKAIICKRTRKIRVDKKEQFDFILPTVYYGLIIDSAKNKYSRFWFKLLAFFHLVLIINGVDLFELQTRFTIKKLFKKYHFNENDIIIFPSADYYGIKAFLKRLISINIEKRPRVHLRYIGVFENANSYYKDHFMELIDLMNKTLETLSVSAEVPIYARYINALLPKINVVSEPYPILNDKYVVKKAQRNVNKPFTIVLPGTNRADKGYADIFYLAKEILFEFPSVRLIVQDMKKWDKNYNRKYRNKLFDLANVSLVNAILSREGIENLYEQADLILFPYCAKVYHYRGSGIHYEAIQQRVPVLVKKGVGFEEEVKNWSSGWLYETKQDLFLSLKKIMNLDVSTISNQMENAFLKLKQKSNEAYSSHLS